MISPHDPKFRRANLGQFWLKLRQVLQNQSCQIVANEWKALTHQWHSCSQRDPRNQCCCSFERTSSRLHLLSICSLWDLTFWENHHIFWKDSLLHSPQCQSESQRDRHFASCFHREPVCSKTTVNNQVKVHCPLIRCKCTYPRDLCTSTQGDYVEEGEDSQEKLFGQLSIDKCLVGFVAVSIGSTGAIRRSKDLLCCASGRRERKWCMSR